MNYVAILFAGILITNSIPHAVSGVQGIPFPSPFSKPMGIGPSSPLVNFLWGALNFFVGIYLLSMRPITVGLNSNFIVLVVGVVACGVQLSLHFGKVRRSQLPPKTTPPATTPT